MTQPLVEMAIEDPRWEDAGLAALAQRSTAAVFAHLGLAPSGFSVSLLGCDDARIAVLNADFLGKSAPTNVLSWPSSERAATQDGVAPLPPQPGSEELPEELGDIAIAYDTCAREAQAAGRSLREHAAHLLVHGLLHLLGSDHARDKDAALMESLEVEILATMGVADPYGTGVGRPE